MERVLLFGGSGILGTEVLRILQNEKIEYVSPASSDLDVRDKESVSDSVRDFKPTWIVNCAAWTNVDGAEHSFEMALELNEMAVRNIGVAATSIDCKVIHISTDYVFDGESSVPYSESSIVNPINKYGISKLKGEEALMTSNSSAYIVRSSWLYGAIGHNFVKTIARKALRKEPALVVDDQVGSPTSARDLAAAILSIITTLPKPGIYNYSNEGTCSWFEFARTIYKIAGADPGLVEAISTQSLNSRAKRPKFSLLSKEKWKAAGLSDVPCWEESLELLLPEIILDLNY